MGEIVHFPQEPDKPIYDIDPYNDEQWDMVISAAYRTGEAIIQIDGKFYVIKAEDLQTPPDAA